MKGFCKQNNLQVNFFVNYVGIISIQRVVMSEESTVFKLAEMKELKYVIRFNNLLC
jgi:hypothetical protein